MGSRSGSPSAGLGPSFSRALSITSRLLHWRWGKPCMPPPCVQARLNVHDGGMPRSLLIDVSPLRRSRPLRALLGGQVISVLGTQMAAVAVPYQVYRLTGSSLDVGLVSLAALVPLLAGSLLGGSIVD